MGPRAPGPCTLCAPSLLFDNRLTICVCHLCFHHELSHLWAFRSKHTEAPSSCRNVSRNTKQTVYRSILLCTIASNIPHFHITLPGALSNPSLRNRAHSTTHLITRHQALPIPATSYSWRYPPLAMPSEQLPVIRPSHFPKISFFQVRLTTHSSRPMTKTSLPMCPQTPQTQQCHSMGVCSTRLSLRSTASHSPQEQPSSHHQSSP